MESILKLKNVSKFFNGICVLDNVSFDLHKGEVHALLGENGAGKSTLMKIIMGEYICDQGSIFFEGMEINNISPEKALKMGLAMIHQEFHNIPHITIADYLFLGREPHKLRFVPDKVVTNNYSKQLLENVRFNIDPKTMMRDLTLSELQMVEIAKVLSYQSKILILDEPTSSLTDKEANRLFEIIEDLKTKGVAIVYISHRLEELDRIADKVTILLDGKVTVSTDFKNITRDRIIASMVGREISDIFEEPNKKLGEEIFKVERLTSKGQFEDISFSARTGEVIGLAGLVGAGRTEIATAIFGVNKLDAGSIIVNGKKVRIKNASQSIKNGIAYISEDRKVSGLNTKGDVQDNLTLPFLKALCGGPLIRNKRLRTKSLGMIEKLNIKIGSLKDSIANLSGGNQQKVTIGKWLMKELDILILDEPTRGIDVGAKAEIYKLINQLSREGKTIILISSDMLEIIGLCNKVWVLFEGHITGILERPDICEINIMTLAMGGSQIS